MAKIGMGFQLGLSWVPLHDHKVPRNAIKIDSGIYVARASFCDELIPGKYVEAYQKCYIPHGGNEQELDECEILCDSSIHEDGSW